MRGIIRRIFARFAKTSLDFNDLRLVDVSLSRKSVFMHLTIVLRGPNGQLYSTFKALTPEQATDFIRTIVAEGMGRARP